MGASPSWLVLAWWQCVSSVDGGNPSKAAAPAKCYKQAKEVSQSLGCRAPCLQCRRSGFADLRRMDLAWWSLLSGMEHRVRVRSTYHGKLRYQVCSCSTGAFVLELVSLQATQLNPRPIELDGDGLGMEISRLEDFSPGRRIYHLTILP